MNWSFEDEARAAKEGWQYINGYVREKARNGSYLSPQGIIEHLVKKGFKSEWHRDVYLALPWTEADRRLAEQQHWTLAIFPKCYIRKTNSVFLSNEDAQLFVMEQASREPNPDPVCMKAASTIAKYRLLQGEPGWRL